MLTGRANDAQLIEAQARDVQVRFRFRHALTRDAILAGLLPPERAAMARGTLEVVECAHPAFHGEWCELGTEPAQMAGDLRRAAELLREIGRHALSAGALVTAEVTLERARDCSLNDPHLVASACRSLLRKAGAPVPRKGHGESDVPPALWARGVTSREMDVLLLLAKGLSNREIGAQLFLPPRTIERHVENLTAKLDIQGRSQLVAFAAGRAALNRT